MTTTTPRATQLQGKRLREFLTWTMIMATGFGTFEAVVGLYFGHLKTSIAGVAIWSIGAAAGTGIWQTRRGKIQQAVLIFYGIMSLFVLLEAYLQPFMLVTLTAVVLLPIGVALPYLDQQILRRLLLASFALATTIGVVGQLAPPTTGLPEWFIASLRISSLPAALGLVLLLLWQYNSRQSDTLHALSGTNEALAATQANLQRQAEEALRRQQAEADNRRRLEVAVNEIRAFVQQVARGDLSQQLVEGSAGALAELKAGLNEMVTELAAAQGAAHRLQEAEAAGRRQLEQVVACYLAFVNQVARGDLAQRLPVAEEGALGELGHGLNTMAESLQGLTRQIHQASANIAEAAVQILQATAIQSSSAREQSSAIVETQTVVEEVATIAMQTAQQASRAAGEGQEMLRSAQEGSQAVDNTVEGMGRIRQQVGSIAETILSLSKQTQAIGSIIATVNELADQSNLLALNAAIEAARAGEQGKSFAVVAQHVRDLAERSKSATAQVRKILNEILQATNAAVLVTEEGTKGVEAGAQLASQAGQIISHIQVKVERSAQANLQMAAAAEQQTIGMEQIGQAIGLIQEATNDSVSNTRQVERSAKDLYDLAQSLQLAIATYRI